MVVFPLTQALIGLDDGSTKLPSPKLTKIKRLEAKRTAPERKRILQRHARYSFTN
jgi:hypothetical protein